MNVYLYLDRNTFIHRLDPVTKIFLLLTIFIAAFAFGHPAFTAAVLVAEILMVWLSQSWPNVKRIWKLLLTITIVTTILFSLTTKGTTPLFWIIEKESVLFGLGMALRLNILIIAGIVFLSTTTNEEIAYALVKLGLPYKLGFAISTSLRLVPTILGTATTITQAQRARGLDLDSGNIGQRLRRAIPIIVPVFITTVRSTHVFTMALESKGFAAKSQRTSLIDSRMSGKDYAVCVLCLAVVAGAVAVHWYGFGQLQGIIV